MPGAHAALARPMRLNLAVLVAVLCALAVWVGGYAVLERWDALNRWLLDDEYIEALMLDVMQRPPPEPPYVVMLGASPAYFAFPKGALGYWKFRPDELPPPLRSHYLGAFTGHEDPLFYFPFLRFMQRNLGILHPGSVVVITVTNFPSRKSEGYAGPAAHHFQWWHARYGLYRYRPGGEIEAGYPEPLMPYILYAVKARRLYAALKKRLWTWPQAYAEQLSGPIARQRKEAATDAAADKERKRAEALWKSPEFNEPEWREPRADVEAGLAAMIRYIQQHDCTVVLLSMPQGSIRRSLFAPFEPSRAFYADVARRYGAVFLDYSSALTDDQFVTKDYIHTSEEGSRVLRESVMPKLAALLGHKR